MKVACIQLSCDENIDLNYQKVIYFINKAIKNKAELIITPEATAILTDSKKNFIKNLII